MLSYNRLFIDFPGIFYLVPLKALQPSYWIRRFHIDGLHKFLLFTNGTTHELNELRSYADHLCYFGITIFDVSLPDRLHA